jgi:hypothetical protein
MADPSVQFPERGFICPNSSDLLHGAVGKPLARQELFSRTPLQPTKPDCWMEGLLAPGIAAVPTTALLQRYAEVFGGRKRVSRHLSGETSSNVTSGSPGDPACIREVLLRRDIAQLPETP